MTDRLYNVLFLCTGNSARSILAESILKKDGAGRFKAFSAGSQPKGQVNPLALKVLEAMDYPTDQLRSKPWEEFAVRNAPVMDFVFTVCDSAAGEACPVWPGQPMTAHWGIEDPAAVEGSNLDKERAFSTAARYMKSRISAFINLPLASIDRLTLQPRLHAIGRMDGATALSMIKVPGSSPELRSALAEASLPTEDLTDDGQLFYRFERGGSTIGFGGYQVCGDDVLVRSVVLTPSARGKGDGRTATELLLGQAAASGARRAYLLTETALPFFERLGFNPIDREGAPEAIKRTRQASSLCPSSAALMARQLDNPAA